MVREEYQEKVQTRARELAEERILDALLFEDTPPDIPNVVVPNPGVLTTASQTPGHNHDPKMEARRQRTRARFRKMLQSGHLNDREIDIEVQTDQTPMLQVFGPMGMEEMGMNLQELFGNMGGRQRKKRRVRIEEAWEMLTKEEAHKLVDMDKVTQEALKRVQESGIVFVDEIDKVASGSGSRRGGPDVSREGVQRDLLPIVEGSNVTTKHGMVRTDHILFIASGAFHVAKPSDLIPEMQGRFPIRVELHSLTEEDFYNILTQPRNALLKQYEALLASEKTIIRFTDPAVHAIARTAARVNSEVENIGARRLHTIMTTLLEDILFDANEARPVHIEINEQMVNNKLYDIASDKDLSQYIL